MLVLHVTLHAIHVVEDTTIPVTTEGMVTIIHTTSIVMITTVTITVPGILQVPMFPIPVVPAEA
jgi:hypothetical protein